LHARIRAGERITQMHSQLRENNDQIASSLDKIQILYDALENDLLEAKKLQQSLVPIRFQELGASQVSVVLKSCGHVGGDLVGFFSISEKQVGIFSIDVSGHGLSSALMTARLAGYLSGSNPDQNIALDVSDDDTISAKSPAAVAKKFNDLIFSEIDTEHYFTLVLAIIDIDTGYVVFTQAGHPYSAVQHADGSVSFHGDGGLPIGLLPEAEFTDSYLTLRAGDRLLLASDGITECQNDENKLLEDEGLADLMTKYKDVPANALLDSLIWELSNYTKDGEFDDDISAVMFEYNHQRKTDLAKN
jgi:sigma-B regulation protein RsbU (phosphoserine phosphatase)